MSNKIEPEAIQLASISDTGEASPYITQFSIAISLKRIADAMEPNIVTSELELQVNTMAIMLKEQGEGNFE